MTKSKKENGFFKKQNTKTVIFSICLFIGVIIESLFFAPLRRLPNYNLILMAIFLVLSMVFIAKTLNASTQPKKVVWGAITGLHLWVFLGQLIPHYGTPFVSAYPHPFSMFQLYSFESFAYLVLFIVILLIAYANKAIDTGLQMMGCVFASTWAIEMYFRSYSTALPETMMPKVAYLLGILFVIVLIGALFGIVKSVTLQRKLFFGYWLYWGVTYAIGAFTVFPNPMPEFW